MKKLFYFLVTFVLCNTNSFSQGCLPEGITFTTQAQIDNFQTNYPGCTEIEGYVFIMGDDITNLDGLLVLTSIDSGLYIGYSNPGVPSLTSLSGLANLQIIGESLVIGNKNVGGPKNNSLLSLTGLESLTFIGNMLDIGGMDALSNLSGLNNLTTIGGLFRVAFNASLVNLEGLDNITSISSIAIERNFSLINLAGLENITSTQGGLRLYANSLTSLSGLENLSSIGGLLIDWCTELDDLSELLNLSTIGDNFVVNRSNISNLSGLSNLVSIGGDFEMFQNTNLINFEGIEGLMSIGGDLSIGIFGLGGWTGNPSLVNLVGFQNLNSAGGSLKVYGNDSLTTLMGLENLTSIGGNIEIFDNLSLMSLSGLDNITASSIQNINILFNPFLATCHVQSICDYLASPNGTIVISENATGCNSQQEVEDACEAVNVNEITLKNEFSIYPNPATNKLFIERNNRVNITDVNIYNTAGQIVLRDNKFSDQIDISSLHRGLYFVELVSNEMRIREKLIVK